jgi:hypothetical protein
LDKDYEVRTIVLRKKIDENDAKRIISQKKTNVFRKFLKKPKPEEVHVHSLNLLFEAILIISGKYTADYFRKATHTLSVDYNVREVVFGDGVFPIKKKSGVLKKISQKSKNKVDLRLEEHVFIDEEDQISFDNHGKEISVPYKINSETIENYPKKILQMHEDQVKKPEITYDVAIKKFTLKLKNFLEPDVRNLNDEVLIKKVAEVYVPIYEARLVGPKKKVGLLRIDAVRNKVL